MPEEQICQMLFSLRVTQGQQSDILELLFLFLFDCCWAPAFRPFIMELSQLLQLAVFRKLACSDLCNVKVEHLIIQPW